MGWVKSENPEIITAVGGPHSSAIPERTLLEFRNFDLAVVFTKENESSGRLFVLDYKTNIPIPFNRRAHYPYEGDLLDKVIREGNTVFLRNLASLTIRLTWTF
jgi:hypothetical protein